jgi:hypothetical protein
MPLPVYFINWISAIVRFDKLLPVAVVLNDQQQHKQQRGSNDDKYRSLTVHDVDLVDY